MSRPLSALDVASRLADVLRREGKMVEAATQLSRPMLLEMVALQRGFSRPVLRYLGLKRVYVELDADD